MSAIAEDRWHMRGIHLIGDLQGCACGDRLLLSCQAMEELLLAECVSAGLTPVARKFHQFHSSAQPAGVTGVVLLEESHACVHTWPEHNCVTLDVYVCSFSKDNRAAARRLFQRLIDAFSPQTAHTQELERGLIVRQPVPTL
jgi:S-adenosylmethionine decarboxylase proenzyme